MASACHRPRGFYAPRHAKPPRLALLLFAAASAIAGRAFTIAPAAA